MTEPAPESSKPPSRREDALAIVKRLRDSGHIAYFAGGSVRDMLLGLTPKDYDIATDAPPDRVRQLFSNTQAVGAAFGVILVRHGKSQIEVATFRTDDKYEDGRRPTAVHFTTAEEDAKRRDFTVNGLFYDPIEDKIIDYVGGQEDLKSRSLRAIGDPNHRFEEDHLRLLRAIRFSARFNLTIESATADAIKRHAEHLKRISPERIAEELRLMLAPPTRNDVWRMLWDFALMPVIFRHLPEESLYPIPYERGAEPVFPALAPGADVSFPLALATLALCYRIAGHYNGPTLPLLERAEAMRTVQALRNGLKISNQDADAVMQISLLGPLLRDDPPSVAVIKRFLSSAQSADARLLLDALRRSQFMELSLRIQWLQKQLERLSKEECAPDPLLTGDDLTAAGFTPGPIFKRILDTAYDAQLEGRITTKDQALTLARELK